MSAVTPFDNFYSIHDAVSFRNEYRGAPGSSTLSFTMDLGAIVEANAMKIWKSDNQTAILTVSVSVDNQTFGPVGISTLRANLAPYPYQDVF